MYRGFKLNINHKNDYEYNLGLNVYQTQNDYISGELTKFLGPNGEIDGTKLEASWFPQIEADVFISHSHKDKELAITFTGWLNRNFGLTAFIDSAIWGHSDYLLKNIDNEFCYNANTKTYNYEKRNLSTSHIHMMLSAALTKMMDRCECLFFLATSNAVTSSNIINENKTNSPWLYYEIGISNLIKKPLYMHNRRKELIKGKSFSSLEESEKRDLQIKYSLDLNHLVNLNTEKLNMWQTKYSSQIPKDANSLDTLYNLF